MAKKKTTRKRTPHRRVRYVNVSIPVDLDAIEDKRGPMQVVVQMQRTRRLRQTLSGVMEGLDFAGVRLEHTTYRPQRPNESFKWLLQAVADAIDAGDFADADVDSATEEAETV